MNYITELKNIRLRNMIFMTAAGIVSAIGVTFFLSPVGLYDSGFSGTSMLLSSLTPDRMSLSLFLLILNFPVFLYGLKKQGGLFTFYALYCVAVYSVSVWLIEDILPFDVSTASPLAGRDLLLCAVFGGIICGFGSGLSVRYGGAIDGVEVLAVIFAKKIGVTVGTFIMVYNVLLYAVCGLIIKSWTLPLYSIVTYMAALKTLDFIVDGFDRAKCALIVTEKPEEVCEELMYAFGIGMTKISVRGGYSNSDKTMIHFVLNRFQVSKMRTIVHETDPTAYITISEVADVFAANSDNV